MAYKPPGMRPSEYAQECRPVSLLLSRSVPPEMAKLQCLACEAQAGVIHSYHDENRFGS